MPELPEVEIITRQLNEHLIGHMVEKAIVHGPQVVRGDLNSLVGGSVVGVERYGKAFVMNFDNDRSLAVHLKMTGQIVYRALQWQSGTDANKYMLSQKVGKLPGKHTRVIFHLNGRARLYYNDIRKFGWLHVLPTQEVGKISFIQSLGHDALGAEIEGFVELLSKSRSSVKIVIMDQRKIAGVGNIYANDALWKASIDPRRAANSLTLKEAQLLLNAIKYVLERGITEGAASDNTYVDALGQEGNYQNHFLVYHREGKRCMRCGNGIERISIGSRGTFLCRVCQK